MSETMVDRVAFILDGMLEQPGGRPQVAKWRPLARAVLEAMREPTEPMMAAYSRAFSSSDRFDGKAVFGQMIDAALNEKSPAQP